MDTAAPPSPAGQPAGKRQGERRVFDQQLRFEVHGC
jgi:hypothetical protein